jgi:hypothetical protein
MCSLQDKIRTSTTEGQEFVREDIKAQWVAALRSGEFEQGKTALKTNEGSYCCLGVLCELAVREGVAVAVPSIGEAAVFYEHSTNYFGPGPDWDSDGMESGLLPEVVQKWAGLLDSNPNVRHQLPQDDQVPGLNEISCLADLNDNRDLSFEAIAAIIEEQL